MHTVEEFLPANKIKLLKQQHYALFGHSAVKTCHYTKSAITEGKMCYKFHFYGINSHQCIQMTPASNFCNQECTFCWRTLGWSKNDWEKVDPPTEIVDESIKAHNKLLSGLGHYQDSKRHNMWKLSQTPKHVAISLTGEPTLYPKLPELIEAYREKGISTFLVSNGTMPDMLEKCKPTQIYISLDAPNKELHDKVNRPMGKDAWDNLNKSLEVMSRHPSRRVIRMTLVKDHNMCDEKVYAQLIKKAQPDFVEVKGYSWVGFSRVRLPKGSDPTHAEIVEWAKKLNEHLGYDVAGEVDHSRIVLLHNKARGISARINFHEGV